MQMSQQEAATEVADLVNAICADLNTLAGEWQMALDEARLPNSENVAFLLNAVSASLNRIKEVAIEAGEKWAAANKDALASVLENERADKSARLAANFC